MYALGTPRLAWQTRVVGTGADGHHADQLVVTDAGTGKVVEVRDHILHGSGNGFYNGPKPFQLATSSSGGTYYLRHPSVANMECRDYATGRVHSGSDDAWGNGAGTDKETGGTDGQFAMEKEHAMLSSWLGRRGIDGNGSWRPLSVGWDAVNAQYNTLTREVRIGHNVNNTWISTVDVVAHEFGHAIDHHTPAGISRGGTQEFVADVFGTATELYAKEPSPYDTPDYEIGDKANLTGEGPIRYMYDPSRKGHPQLLQQLDTFHAGACGVGAGQPLVLPARRGH